jgi:hypothetical protein
LRKHKPMQESIATCKYCTSTNAPKHEAIPKH